MKEVLDNNLLQLVNYLVIIVAKLSKMKTLKLASVYNIICAVLERKQSQFAVYTLSFSHFSYIFLQLAMHGNFVTWKNKKNFNISQIRILHRGCTY